MRHLHRSRVTAELVGAVPDLSGLPGVHDLSVDGSVVSCTVGSEGLPAVLTAITAAGVRTLTSTPPTLEEVFLDAYRRPQEEAAR
jgi:ABC-2 type transport system ATP-binding protein